MDALQTLQKTRKTCWIKAIAEQMAREAEEADIQADMDERARRALLRKHMKDIGGGASVGQQLVNEIEDLKQKRLMVSGHVLAVKRGHCSFMRKALYAASRNASALIIVNTEDRVDAPASGYGIEKWVTERHMSRAAGLPILSVSNTSWSKLKFALENSYQPQVLSNDNDADVDIEGENTGVKPAASIPVQFIPLKCGGKISKSAGNTGGINSHGGGGSTGNCIAVEEEEQLVRQEVSWGILRISNSIGEVKSFQFLTSNFGSVLPTDLALQLQLPISDLIDGNVQGCDVIRSVNSNEGEASSTSSTTALVLDRGGCSFQTKIKNAEVAGARVAIIIDTKDEPLQRIGGIQPDAGYIGMPAVLVTKPCGDFLRDSFRKSVGKSAVKAEMLLSSDDDVASAWIDLAFYAWQNEDDERLLQLQALADKYQNSSNNTVEIKAWLDRQIQAIRGSRIAAIETDGAPEL